jgi:hypothetical protein
MKAIGIIGSGNIGGTLGAHLAKAGYPVMFSSRHPEKLANFANNVGAEYGTVKDAAAFGEVLLFAFPYGKLEEVAGIIRPQENKLIIDINNYFPNRDGAAIGNVLEKNNWRQSQYTAAFFPEAKIVKAFNNIYYVVLRDKAFRKGEDRIGVPYASDDAEAKKEARAIIENLGYEPVDIGFLEDTEILEPGQKLFATEMNKEEIQRIL